MKKENLKSNDTQRVDPTCDHIKLIRTAWTDVIKNFSFICGCNKKHTKKCIESKKKAQKELDHRHKIEEKRRAKKITMTVGEFEDKLETERNSYDYYY